MAELNRDQRFLPCLLDRLRDDDPKSSEESRTQRVISLSRYKEAVVRDLQWLFNASAHLPIEGKREFRLSDFPEAQRSVINFGLRQLCGLMAPDMAAFGERAEPGAEVVRATHPASHGFGEGFDRPAPCCVPNPGRGLGRTHPGAAFRSNHN